MYIPFAIISFISVSIAYLISIKLLDFCKPTFRHTFYMAFGLLAFVFFLVLTSAAKSSVSVINDNYILMNVIFSFLICVSIGAVMYAYLFKMTHEDDNKRFAKVTALTTAGITITIPTLFIVGL